MEDVMRLSVTLEGLAALGLCPVCTAHLAHKLGQLPPPPVPEPVFLDPTLNPARCALEAASLAATDTPTALDVLWNFPTDARAALSRYLLALPGTDVQQAYALVTTGLPAGLDEVFALSEEHRTILSALLRSPKPPRHGPPPDGGWPAFP